MNEVDDVLNKNFQKFMRDGPGLSYEYKTVVLACKLRPSHALSNTALALHTHHPT